MKTTLTKKHAANALLSWLSHPYTGDPPSRSQFTIPKPIFLKKIGPAQKLHTFIKADKTLSNAWWKTSYKADAHLGEHIPNRASARHLSGYSRGLHRELEKHWAKKIRTYFDKKKLKKNTSRSSTILKEARKIDKEFDITFKNEVPKLKTKDIWKEMVFICRGSFAVSSILVPPSKIPYRSKKTTTFEELFEETPEGPPLLREIDKMTMHDAVLNTAIAWKAIWKKLQPPR